MKGIPFAIIVTSKYLPLLSIAIAILNPAWGIMLLTGLEQYIYPDWVYKTIPFGYIDLTLPEFLTILFIVLTILYGLVYKNRLKKILMHPFSIILIVFYLLVLIGSVNSILMGYAVKDTIMRIRSLVFLSGIVFVPYFINSKTKIKSVMLFVNLLLTLFGLTLIYLFATGTRFTFAGLGSFGLMGREQPTSRLLYPGTWLTGAFFLPLYFYTLRGESGKIKVYYLANTLLMAFILFWSQTRTVIFSIIAGMFLTYFIDKKVIRWRHISLTLSMLLIMVLVPYFFIGGRFKSFTDYILYSTARYGSIVGLENPYYQESLRGRETETQWVLKRIGEYPFMGHGMGALFYKPLGKKETIAIHNEILKFLYKGGIITTLVYLLFLFYFPYRGYKAYRKLKDSLRYFVLGVTVTYVGLAPTVIFMNVVTLPTRVWVFALAWGLVMAIEMYADKETK